MLPELAPLWEGLESRRARLLTELRGASDEQLRFRPRGESWSLVEVAHHLELVEAGVLYGLDKGRPPAGRRSLKQWIYYGAVWVVLKTGVKVKVPSRHVVPDPEISLDEVAAAWDEVRPRLAAAFEAIEPESLDQPMMRHPVSGPLDARESLLFMIRHFDHHLRQVGRIRGARDFPATAA